MFHHGQSFNGKFAADCQTICVPNSLMYNNIQNRESEDGGCDTTQQVVSISQLIVIMIAKLPVYVGLKLHATTGKKEVVDAMYALRLSVCYDRVMDIRKCLYSQVCKRYIGIGVVVPPLYHLLFVLTAIDNTDINSSSTTAKSPWYSCSTVPMHLS